MYVRYRLSNKIPNCTQSTVPKQSTMRETKEPQGSRISVTNYFDEEQCTLLLLYIHTCKQVQVNWVQKRSNSWCKKNAEAKQAFKMPRCLPTESYLFYNGRKIWSVTLCKTKNLTEYIERKKKLVLIIRFADAFWETSQTVHTPPVPPQRQTCKYVCGMDISKNTSSNPKQRLPTSNENNLRRNE